MNILEFINSEDIAKYLKEIDYKFDSLQCAYIIFQNKRYNLYTKHAAWNDLMREMPDMLLPRRNDKSLFEFLQEYMMVEDELIEKFYETENSSYQCSYKVVGEEFPPVKRRNLCDLAEYIEENKDVSIRKTFMYENGTYGIIEVQFNERGKVQKIIDTFSENGMTGDCIIKSMEFEKWNISFPLPFKKGDIVQCKRSDSNLYFVFDGLGFFDNSKFYYYEPDYVTFPEEYQKEGNECFGYRCTETGQIIRCATSSILDMEYCRRENYMYMNRLNMVSDYITGKIDFLQLLTTYRSCILRTIRDEIGIVDMNW